MKEKSKNNIIRILACSALVVSIYPAMAELRAMLFLQDGGVAGALLAATITASGLLVGLFLIKEHSKVFERLASSSVIEFLYYWAKKKPSVASITSGAVHAAFIIPAAAVFLFYRWSGTARLLFEVLAAVLLYFLGLRAVYYKPGDMMSMRKIYSGITFLVLSLIAVTYYPGTAYLKPYVFGAGYYFALISLVLRNQESLDYYILSRKDLNASKTVRNIRRYNIIVTLILFAILLLLFNFRVIAGYALQISAALVFILTYFVFWLMSLLFSFSGKSEGEMKGGGFPPELRQEGSGNPLLDIILQLLLLALLVFIAIKMAPSLYKRVKRVLSAILAFLAGKLRFRSSTYTEQGQSRDYIDETEFIAPEKGSKRAGILKRLPFLRRIGQAESPAARIRFIYTGLLALLAGAGITIRKSDTAREISRKAEGISGAEEKMLSLTEFYEKVRYGGIIPEADDVTLFEKGSQYMKALLQKVKGPRNG